MCIKLSSGSLGGNLEHRTQDDAGCCGCTYLLRTTCSTLRFYSCQGHGRNVGAKELPKLGGYSTMLDNPWAESVPLPSLQPSWDVITGVICDRNIRIAKARSRSLMVLEKQETVDPGVQNTWCSSNLIQSFIGLSGWGQRNGALSQTDMDRYVRANPSRTSVCWLVH